MRELFISERRYIGNVIWKHAQVSLQTGGPVVVEHYARRRTSSQVRFNNDFLLQFVPCEGLERFKSFGASILPNTIGVDVFVTVDEQTFQPLMTELLGGEAFPMKYFREYIKTVEVRLAQLSHPIKLRRTSYCRMFVIESDICFLAFTEDPTPVVRGERELLCADEDSSIVCSKEGDNIVYVDGWIRTSVTESNCKLEAIPVGNDC